MVSRILPKCLTYTSVICVFVLMFVSSCNLFPKNSQGIIATDIDFRLTPSALKLTQTATSWIIKNSSTPTPSNTSVKMQISTPIAEVGDWGNIIFVANSEIYLVDASCAKIPQGCSTNWRQLTNTPNLEQQFAAEIFPDQIAASPDGSFMAFAYRELIQYQGQISGGWDIYLLDIEKCIALQTGCDSNLFIPLTADPGDELSPAWSPNGDLIAFSSNQGSDKLFQNSTSLFVIDPNGSNQKRLIEDNAFDAYPFDIANPAWSPDGNFLAFSTTIYNRIHPDTFIYTIGINSLDITKLTYQPKEENTNNMDLRPQWANDGSHIIFVSNRNHVAGIYQITKYGENISQLVNKYADFPHWSPDGSKVAFISAGNDSYGSLWIMEVDRKLQYRIIDRSNSYVKSFVWVP